MSSTMVFGGPFGVRFGAGPIALAFGFGMPARAGFFFESMGIT
jgi:hypothetical protein